MHELGRVIDVSAWTGTWPFVHLRYRHLSELRAKLEEGGTEQVFVSPIEAILEQDPHRANDCLLEETARVGEGFFSPVPIIDLSFPNWREAAAAGDRVRMVKILPNYHMYGLCEERMAPLVEFARDRELIICVQIRVEDARGQYPLMKVAPLDLAWVAKTLSAFPEQVFLLNNCYLTEVEAVLPWMENVYVDIASLETQDILRVLQNRFGLERFVFGGHCPFYYPEGNFNKLRYADVSSDAVEAVAWRNTEHMLSSLG